MTSETRDVQGGTFGVRAASTKRCPTNDDLSFSGLFHYCSSLFNNFICVVDADGSHMHRVHPKGFPPPIIECIGQRRNNDVGSRGGRKLDRRGAS